MNGHSGPIRLEESEDGLLLRKMGRAIPGGREAQPEESRPEGALPAAS